VATKYDGSVWRTTDFGYDGQIVTSFYDGGYGGPSLNSVEASDDGNILNKFLNKLNSVEASDDGNILNKFLNKLNSVEASDDGNILNKFLNKQYAKGLKFLYNQWI
jgi:hypothetical protein